ncbi:MAG: hypothetical protein Q7S38_00905 [bacterium]|nr:hypothetical protein [bacterium]
MADQEALRNIKSPIAFSKVYQGFKELFRDPRAEEEKRLAAILRGKMDSFVGNSGRKDVWLDVSQAKQLELNRDWDNHGGTSWSPLDIEISRQASSLYVFIITDGHRFNKLVLEGDNPRVFSGHFASEGTKEFSLEKPNWMLPEGFKISRLNDWTRYIVNIERMQPLLHVRLLTRNV